MMHTRQQQYSVCVWNGLAKDVSQAYNCKLRGVATWRSQSYSVLNMTEGSLDMPSEMGVVERKRLRLECTTGSSQ
jgi:hypothetical protein